MKINQVIYQSATLLIHLKHNLESLYTEPLRCALNFVDFK